jgi:hypothetical protein
MINIALNVQNTNKEENQLFQRTHVLTRYRTVTNVNPLHHVFFKNGTVFGKWCDGLRKTVGRTTLSPRKHLFLGVRYREKPRAAPKKIKTISEQR